MAKRKYRFNPDTLNYEEHGTSFREFFGRFMAFFTSSLAFSFVIVLVVIHFYETPGSKAIKRENQRLLSQYMLMQKDMETVYQVLDELQQRDDNLYRVIFETEPIPSDIRKAGFGGVNKYAHLENLENGALVIAAARRLDVLSKQVYVQSKSYDELMKLALTKEEMLASIPAIQPVANVDLKQTASGWGDRIHPIYKIKKFHYGMDFTAPTGTEVYATGDGVVEEVTSALAGYGNLVSINHGYGYTTLYAHLSATRVRTGQKVKRGELVGLVGSTGTSTAPHLHYEVHKNGEPVNPQYFYYLDLTPLEYEKMIAISSNMGQSFD